MSFHTARLATEKAVFRPALPLCSMPGITEMHMAKLTFSEQIKHPNWQKKRLEVMGAADFECENCGAKDVTLNVHHKQYIKGRMYWEYERHELECLCEDCHKHHHEAQDGFKTILASVNMSQAFGLLAGFHHHSDWVDRPTVYSGREADRMTYAAGLVAWLTEQLGDIDAMHKVAAYAVSLAREDSEAAYVFRDAGHIFGKGV